MSTVTLSIADNPIELGQHTVATVNARDQFGAPIDAGPAAFTSSSPDIALVSPTGQVFGLSTGTVQISATVGGKTGQASLIVARPLVRINEIVTKGDAPGGWVELVNPTTAAVDVSGWTLGSSDLRELVSLAPGTSIPPVGYLVIDEDRFPAGLRDFDSLLVFSRFGSQVDSHFWSSSPANGSIARCPDSVGPLVVVSIPTRGAPNVDCAVVRP